MLAFTIAAALQLALLAHAYDPIQMLCSVNRIRGQHGLDMLGLDEHLTYAAQKHSDYQARKRRMGHDGSGGSQPSDRVTAAGYDWRSVAENVAYGYEDQEECLEQWMASPGHRKNILSRDSTHFGSAVAYDGSTPYYTQDFAGDGKRHNYPECPSGYGDEGDNAYGQDEYGSYAPSSDHYGSYAPSSDNYGSYAPSSDNYGSYAPSSNDYGSYAPSSNDYGSYGGNDNYGSYAPSSGNYGSYGGNDNYGSYAPSSNNYGSYAPSSGDYGSYGGRPSSRDHREPTYGGRPSSHDAYRPSHDAYRPSHGRRGGRRGDDEDCEDGKKDGRRSSRHLYRRSAPGPHRGASSWTFGESRLVRRAASAEHGMSAWEMHLP